MKKTMKFDRSAVQFGVFALYAVMQCTYAAAGSRMQEAPATPVRSIASRNESLGRSATLLPSGNMLLVGGQNAGEMSGLVSVENPQTGAVTTLPISLVFHRAFHTATLLPDGSVLVFGGTGTGNEVVPAAERIDLASGSIQLINTGTLTPRAHHTATLLTDGTILYAGGVDGNGATLNSLEVWDFRTGTCSKLPIQLQTSRKGHEAALLPNGSVLIWGGVDAYGYPVSFGEVIDPQNLTSYGQRVIELPANDPQPPQLAISIPADDASNVAVNVMFALRFSKPLQMASVNSTTLVLTGPSGPVPATVIPAEGGMLAFVQPLTTLEIGSNYTLDISGAVDNSGQQLADTRVAFSTTGSTATDPIGLSGSNSTSDTTAGSTTGTTADSSVATTPSQSATDSSAASSTSATPSLEPNIRTHFTTTPVSFERMRQNVESSTNLPKANVVRAMAMESAGGSAAPEIVALANGLNNDPDLIYQYVHDNIEFSPLFGALKGPVGTLLDGRGDSFDQAALMVALLNQASLSNPSISSVLLEFGTLNLSNAQLQGWLGVDSNPNSVMGVLSSGGIPYTSVDASGDVIGMGHVWVKVSINGAPYVFDPAFKAHSWRPGVVGSLASAMGYSRSQFLADANPTSLTSTSIQGINRTQLRSDLTAYASNLTSYIQNNYPTAGVSDIIGGGVIVPTPLSNGQTLRQTSNPNQSGTPTDWTAIPSQYDATISITIPGATVQTYNSSDIYGHRLSIFFSSTYVPTLYLDGTAVTSGSASSQGTQVGIQFIITIPWATWASSTRTQYIGAQTNQGGGSSGYVIQTGWDQVGRGMIEKHRSLLNQAIASGAAYNSELVLGEGLEMLGLTWLAECASQQQIADRLLGTTTQYFYGGGIVGETVGTSSVGPYVDLPLNFINTPARINGASTQTANSLAAFVDASGVSSSFESASLEQTQAQIPGFVAASAIKLLDTAVQNGNTIYDINNSATGNNWSTVQAILAPNYKSADLTTIGGYVNGGYRVIAPSNGKIAIGNWTGVGYKAMYSSGSSMLYGELISGQMNGGFSGTPVQVQQLIENNLKAQGLSNVIVSVSYTNPGSGATGGDPISLQKGSSQYQHDDLDVGAKGFPYGLNFQRIYDSNAQGTAGPLGNGWTHNYAISASVNSDGFTSMGQGAPLNSARSIAALYVSSDLMNGQALNGQTNLENYVVEAIVNRWLTDQVTSNIVTVQQGWNTEEFVLMPNGSYSSPVGSASILDVNGGNLRYRTKSGVTMTFSGNPTATSGPVYIASLTSPGGASVSFSYSGGNLTGVSNSATGRSLSINYNGSQISSVSDNAGRSVSYTISGGNLTQFTDAQQQNTTYSYDTSGAYDTAGHLTQIFYPSNPTNAFLTNYYDGLGHVWKQQDANQNTSQVSAAGARMEIDDAAGNRHVYFNDPLGNVLKEIQDYGDASHLNATTVYVYNGQSLLVSKTLPEGNSTTYTYDSQFNPLTITQYPKPGSGLAAVQQTITYTHPVSALPSLEVPYQVTDAKGYVTTFKYDSYGNVIEVDQPAVPKPGASAAQPTSLYTYTSIGMVQTATDPEGRVTRYDYFPGNADQVQKMTVDYGRLNYVTQYTYDNFGDVCTVTDPNNNVTTTVHDALGRVTEEDAPNALSITKYDYYPNGQVHDVYREQNTPSVSSPATCTTNSTEASPVWETTTYTYTPSNKVYQVTDPLGNTTTTAYDGADRVYTVTQPVSSGQYRVSVNTYDILSRPYQVSVGSGASTSAAVASATVQATYAYTLNGRQKSITDANNNLTGMTYDGFDRLSSTIYPDSTTEQFQYDANNNVTEKTTRSGQTISSSYDALNRIQTKTPQGEAAGTVTYGYDYSGRMLQASDSSSSTPYQIGYDTAGRANSYTDQLGRNTQVAYDGAGNQTEVIWPAGTSGTGSYSVTYQYDAMNRMQYVNEGGTNNLLAQYSWDALSRTQSIAYGDGTSDAYSQYDAGDNLQTLTQTYNGSNNSVTFNYTWLMNHQLNSTGVNNPLFQYVPQAGTVSYGAANADNGLTTMTASSGSATMTYDGNHNLTYDGTNTLSYDVENRMVQAENLAWGASTYLYDPLGQRKQKVVGVNTAMPVATDFVLAGGEEIADYYETSATWRLTVRGAGDLPLAAVVPAAGGGSEEIVYVHHDMKGSTVALTVAGGSGVGDSYTYSDYGQPQSGSWLAYQYAGYRYDSETGLYNMPARSYSPALGRFLQADPSGFGGGFNLYAYAGNDPVNSEDHSGQSPDGGGYTITLSESVHNYFMGLFGFPSTTVSVTAHLCDFNTQAFANALDSNAAINLITGKPKSVYEGIGACAKYVRTALEAGGINTSGRPQYGGNYGSFLSSIGFSPVSLNGYVPQQGDLAVFSSPGQTADKTHPGHIAGYDGRKWVSDFYQKRMSPYSSSTTHITTVFRYRCR